MRSNIKKYKGSVTLEYVIMITGVISVLIVFLQPKGHFVKSLTSIIGTTANQMERDLTPFETESFIPGGEVTVATPMCGDKSSCGN